MNDDGAHFYGISGLDSRLYCIDGTPWCRFGRGTTRCINGDDCLNPNHHSYTHTDDRDPWMSNDDFERDRYGRAMVTLPGDTKPTPLTRATTLAKTLDDQYHLGIHKACLAVFGVTRPERVDLFNLASSISDFEDGKKTLKDVVDQAMAVAGGAVAANEGTFLHTLTQRVDERDRSVVIPDQWRDHITRYKTIIEAFRVVWAHIEIPLVLPDILVAGTADRIDEDGIVWDLKTGKTLDFAKIAIAQQLATYSRATYRWDPKTHSCVDAPQMNQSEARVIWLPAKGNVVKVYSVDIEQGWDLATKSVEVRAIQKDRGKALFTEIEPKPESLPEVQPTPTADREGALRKRVKDLVKAGHASKLLDKWAVDVPTLAEGGLSDAQLDLAESWVYDVEMETF